MNEGGEMSLGTAAVAGLAMILGLGGVSTFILSDDQSTETQALQMDDEGIKRQDDDDDDVLAQDDDDDGDGDNTRGNDGTSGGNNTGDGDNTRANDGTSGGDNTFVDGGGGGGSGSGGGSASGGGDT
jgi:hypothetical protein